MQRVLVALSGGIDSAATLMLLRDEGYDVAAVTFDMTGNEADIASAKGLAAALDVDISVINVRDRFHETIIRYFVEGYMRGETPAPCSVCNPAIKWQILLETANSRGFDKIATGHYCRIEKTGSLFYVHRGLDPVKDQSYYLWGLRQDVLSRALTPLGSSTKCNIRTIMASSGFGFMSQRAESMGVCFLRGESYGDFLARHVSGLDALAGGRVMDSNSAVIGSHRGYPYYTIGQKRGFDLHCGENNMYVTAIDSAENIVTVGPREDLYRHEITLGSVYSANIDEILASSGLSVMIRGIGLNPSGYCTARSCGNGRIALISDELMYAPAKGQPAVFYIGDRVVGGGIIEE